MKIYIISSDNEPLLPSNNLSDYCWIDPMGNVYEAIFMHTRTAQQILKYNLNRNYAQVGHPVQELLKEKWLRVCYYGQHLEAQTYHPSFFSSKQKQKLIEIALATGKTIIELEVWGGETIRTIWEKDNIMDN